MISNFHNGGKRNGHRLGPGPASIGGIGLEKSRQLHFLKSAPAIPDDSIRAAGCERCLWKIVHLSTVKTYQIILKGGLTRNVQADRFKTLNHHLVFYTEGTPVSRFEASTVITVDEIGGIAGPEAPERDPSWDYA